MQLDWLHADISFQIWPGRLSTGTRKMFGITQQRLAKLHQGAARAWAQSQLLDPSWGSQAPARCPSGAATLFGPRTATSCRRRLRCFLTFHLAMLAPSATKRWRPKGGLLEGARDQGARVTEDDCDAVPGRGRSRPGSRERRVQAMGQQSNRLRCRQPFPASRRRRRKLSSPSGAFGSWPEAGYKRSLSGASRRLSSSAWNP